MSTTPNGHQIAARLTAITGPYELLPGLHLFTDWRFIEPGAPSDLGHGVDQPVYFRFRLRAAKLFAFEVAD